VEGTLFEQPITLGPSLPNRKEKLVGDFTADKAFNRLPRGLAWENTRLTLSGNDK
jgi:hypothetical protein